MSLHELVQKLAGWTKEIGAAFITYHEDRIVVAHEDQVSTTKSQKGIEDIGAYMGTWWLQQPDQIFQALSTAAWCYKSE